MRPVRTSESNFTYKGDGGDIGDLPCEQADLGDGNRAVYAVYEPTDEDRAAIAAGANLKIGIWNMEPIPPVSVAVTAEEALEDQSAPGEWPSGA